MKRITIEELHERLIMIAKAFHEICVKHHIPYYMSGGSMLGAIRHKDIIPWDDDMDFGVPREHYDRLHTILKEELPAEMYVADIENSERIKTDTFKIVLKNTMMVENGKSSPWGIFVDVFPIDSTSTNNSLFSMNQLIHIIVKYGVYAYYEKTDSAIRNAVGAIVTFVNPFSRRSIVKFTRKLIKKNSKRHNDALVYFGGYYSIKKEVMRKEIFGTPALYDIGGTELYGVERPHEYLTHLYGNYMELPPIEKRHVHCDEVWVETNIK